MQIFNKGDRVRIKATNEFYGLVGTTATVMFKPFPSTTTDDILVFLIPDDMETFQKYYRPNGGSLIEWSNNLERIHPAHIERRNGRRVLVIND